MTTIPRGHVYIPEDTIIEIELTKTISSKTLKVGDVLPFVTVKNLIINDVIVIPRNAKVKAVVTRARKSGVFGRGGRLEFSIVSVKTMNGIEIPLEYRQQDKAGNDDGAVALAALVTVVGGVFMRGKNVVISEGTRIETRVTADTDLETTVANLANAMKENRNENQRIVIAQ